ncbi:MAG: hypothetical protein M1486_06300 [Gammaproteobacteria bacterium]|nr:hypothetical protein [Gammaproteobacteria bacterium]
MQFISENGTRAIGRPSFLFWQQRSINDILSNKHRTLWRTMAKKGKARVLNENEFKRLLIMAKDSSFALRNVAIIYCSFGLGLRVKEIAALTFQDMWKTIPTA